MRSDRLPRVRGYIANTDQRWFDFLRARPRRDEHHRPEVAVTRATRRITLFAITAPGIADLAIGEALYTAYEVIVSA